MERKPGRLARLPEAVSRLPEAVSRLPGARSLLSLLPSEGGPLELQMLGRTLLHAAVVGAAAGLIGAGFFALLEWTQRVVLEQWAGCTLLKSKGEMIVGEAGEYAFHPWLLMLLPAVGALVSGLLSLLAPEIRGGGGDAMIRAFHHEEGRIRRRVTWLKGLASIATLGSGGAGGREGPTMQIGAALGSFVARTLKMSIAERRILLVAGVAAGLSAVFRTPLGAALLAIEVLYRDDFEAEALIPAILASVVSYSVVISIYGETTLFGRLPSYVFEPSHIPLYIVLALLIALLASTFETALHKMRELTERHVRFAWLRPVVGGLLLGVMVAPLLASVGESLGTPGKGLGILGGGYGSAQVAITGSEWLPAGWQGVELLLLLCGAKLLASTFTIGSGGSAGDFAPSLVLGALLGGAFGRAAGLLLDDPTLDPGAFALVGMGTFYGGIAHVPVASLVLVCEMAGSYDLLVPLMLCGGIAFVVLRQRTLYHAQVPSRRDSPAHRASLGLAVLSGVHVGDVLMEDRTWVSFPAITPTAAIMKRLPEAAGQDVFPIVDEKGALVGLISSDTVRYLAVNREAEPYTIALDIMQPPVSVRVGDELRTAAERMIGHGLREIPVVDDAGVVLGQLDEADIFRAYLKTSGSEEATGARRPARAGGVAQAP